MGLHHRRESPRPVSRHPGRAAHYVEEKKRFDYQCLVNDRSQRLCQFYRLRDFEMGARGIYTNTRGRGQVEEYPGQLRRPGLCCHETNRLRRQQTGIDHRCFCLPCFRLSRRDYRQGVELFELGVASKMNPWSLAAICGIDVWYPALLLEIPSLARRMFENVKTDIHRLTDQESHLIVKFVSSSSISVSMRFFSTV